MFNFYKLALLSLFLPLVVPDPIPAYKCVSTGRDQCRFSDIRLTRMQPHYKLVLDDSLRSVIKTVTFQTSVIPIWTGDVCNYFPALDKIMAEKCQVEEIQADAFYNCTVLTNIDFAFNHIKTLHLDTFQSLRNLNTLYLHNNNLTYFPVELVRGLTKLEKLALISNHIKEIDEVRLEAELPALENIWINDNDFRCDRVQKIVDSLKKNNRATVSLYIAGPRQRSYSTRKISDVICLSDAQWLREITQSLQQQCSQCDASPPTARLDVFENKTQFQFESSRLRLDLLQNKLDQQSSNSDRIAMRVEEVSARATNEPISLREMMDTLSETVLNRSVQHSDYGEKIAKLEERVSALEQLYSNISETMTVRMQEMVQNLSTEFHEGWRGVESYVAQEMAKVKYEFPLEQPENLQANEDGQPSNVWQTVVIAGATSFLMIGILLAAAFYLCPHQARHTEPN